MKHKSKVKLIDLIVFAVCRATLVLPSRVVCGAPPATAWIRFSARPPCRSWRWATGWCSATWVPIPCPWPVPSTDSLCRASPHTSHAISGESPSAPISHNHHYVQPRVGFVLLYKCPPLAEVHHHSPPFLHPFCPAPVFDADQPPLLGSASGSLPLRHSHDFCILTYDLHFT